MQLNRQNLPAHIAIIMDGNGRWAKKQGMMRLFGHQAGVKTVKKIVEAAREIGISVLTLYAFSTENWQRPADEVSGLMSLLKSYLESELASMLKNDVQLRSIGQLENLPLEVQQVLNKSIAETADNSGLILNLALSYGGKIEVISAARQLAELCLKGEIKPADINEELFSSKLYTAGLPDPDLLIRTGGEARLSNFLLWQASYAEIYFTDIAWPDFTKNDLIAAITSFQQRQRRFGRTGEQVARK
jgi:undecaprenyl diphosphate synthase